MLLTWDLGSPALPPLACQSTAGWDGMPGGSFRARLGGVRAGVNACLLSGTGSEGTDMALGREYTGVFLEGGGALGLAFGFRGGLR